MVTSGTFSLDGGTWQVENNVWIVGDDEQCVVIDPAHDAAAVTAAVGDTGRSYSDLGTIIESIRTRLLTLPPATEVLPGHGEPTTVGAEAPHLQEWIDRGL
ncbi:hypothetical protein GMA12_13855 [Kocuria sediminis]|uniref:MBL fold metallo-hydrolase n=1 Tax=Kocuria sediminis TaxID=1038857 RepID=A0A6N8GPR3_9MICC|nr:hypothetical protein [Kocuria sediminis]MUN64207.1 hypothetical protein [Kocuria sediminis]